ncbi:hypothetical protein [Paraurantiacibacter namhicola]|uniref:Uncharacterized protein n=1 Tax=Paraurantiacibacter namhicola TaxID=645517 RepID=A0A1C7D9S4_9SPHN|nr:hypothetical protein [Paraurantiacibacter namhicola]ANU08198.1 hypothetical protein A6F65_01905 [Paraurantiacibacter namhicola]
MGLRTLIIALAAIALFVLLLAWLDGGQVELRPIEQDVDLGPGEPV